MDNLINIDKAIKDFQFTQELARCRTLQGFFRGVQGMLKPYGLTDFALVLSKGDGFQKLWMYPEKSQDRYVEGRLHEMDFHVRHCMNSDELMLQSWVDSFVDKAPVEDSLIAVNKDIRHSLHDIGIENYGALGFTPSSSGGERARAIFSISAKGAPSDWVESKATANAEQLRRIALAVEYVGGLHHGMTLGGKSRGSQLIPNKPLELLRLIANDFTLSDAAAEMNITKGTANQHMYIAKKCLGAHTQAGAVVKAIKQGLIPIC
jgi:DNA-binding CsgD family transcriptional regulator